MPAVVLRPPTPLVWSERLPSVFLAGSIEMGRAVDWQLEVTRALSDLDVVILNPRRAVWDASWEQSAKNPLFEEQVSWELDAQARASLLLFYFSPETQAPVTLLELGLAATSGRAIVSCPDGYFRKGNVEIVCARHRIPLVESLDALIDAARRRLDT